MAKDWYVPKPIVIDTGIIERIEVYFKGLYCDKMNGISFSGMAASTVLY